MPANPDRPDRSGADPQFAPPLPPDQLRRLWRSIPSLAYSLNDGEEKKKTFTEHSLRHYVRFASTNGLAEHVRRLGKKIIIDEYGFRKWIDQQGRDS